MTLGHKDRKPPESDLSEESAEAILAIFLDYYEIYPQQYATKGEVTIYESSCKKLIKAIRAGKLEIEKDGEGIKITHTCRGGGTLEYKEFTNEAKLIDSGAKEAEDQETMGAAMSRRYASVMGYLSGAGYDAMKQLKPPDIGIMESLGFLLLGL